MSTLRRNSLVYCDVNHQTATGVSGLFRSQRAPFSTSRPAREIAASSSDLPPLKAAIA